MITVKLWPKIYIIACVALVLVSCQAQAIVHIDAQPNQDITMLLRAESIVPNVIMNYFEDIDLLTNTAPLPDGLPAVLNEFLGTIAPYVDVVRLERLDNNRLRLHLEIESMAKSTVLQEKAGLGFLSYFQDKVGSYHLRMAMTATEIAMLYENIPSLPPIPDKWDKNSRKKYAQQLANLFGATKKEKEQLENIFLNAIFTVQMHIPTQFHSLSVSKNKNTSASASNEIAMQIDMLDFLTGNDWVELQWQVPVVARDP